MSGNRSRHRRRRRPQWPYALALFVLLPAALAFPLYTGYQDAQAEDDERERVVPAGHPATWQGATWQFMSIGKGPTVPGIELPSGGVYVIAAVTVTPQSRAAAKRLAAHCHFQLRDSAGRRWDSVSRYGIDYYVDWIELDMPGSCQVKAGYDRRPILVGAEHVMYAPFVIPREALAQAELRVVLRGKGPRRVLRFAR